MGKQLTDIVRILFPALQEEKRQQILKDFERTEVQYLYEYGATLYAGVKETVVFFISKIQFIHCKQLSGRLCFCLFARPQLNSIF